MSPFSILITVKNKIFHIPAVTANAAATARKALFKTNPVKVPTLKAVKTNAHYQTSNDKSKNIKKIKTRILNLRRQKLVNKMRIHKNKDTKKSETTPNTTRKDANKSIVSKKLSNRVNLKVKMPSRLVQIQEQDIQALVDLFTQLDANSNKIHVKQVVDVVQKIITKNQRIMSKIGLKKFVIQIVRLVEARYGYKIRQQFAKNLNQFVNKLQSIKKVNE